MQRPEQKDGINSIAADTGERTDEKRGIANYFAIPRLYLVNQMPPSAESAADGGIVFKDKTIHDKTIHDKTIHDKTIHDKTMQDKTIHDKTMQDKIMHDKIMHDKIMQDKIMQDKIMQKNPARKIMRDKNR